MCCLCSAFIVVVCWLWRYFLLNALCRTASRTTNQPNDADKQLGTIYESNLCCAHFCLDSLNIYKGETSIHFNYVSILCWLACVSTKKKWRVALFFRSFIWMSIREKIRSDEITWMKIVVLQCVMWVRILSWFLYGDSFSLCLGGRFSFVFFLLLLLMNPHCYIIIIIARLQLHIELLFIASGATWWTSAHWALLVIVGIFGHWYIFGTA